MYKNIKVLAMLFPGLIIPQKRREDDDQGEGEKKKRKRGPYREFLDATRVPGQKKKRKRGPFRKRARPCATRVPGQRSGGLMESLRMSSATFQSTG